MVTVKLNPKGQITIPANLRKQLHLHIGEEMNLLLQGNRLIITRKEDNIEAAFGLCRANVSVSLEQMEQTIRKRAIS
jgi:AbrB family looped-hinge helix DNA binding protein